MSADTVALWEFRLTPLPQSLSTEAYLWKICFFTSFYLLNEMFHVCRKAVMTCLWKRKKTDIFVASTNVAAAQFC
uniref:Uncharacterized protein n=1 Tax=Anguilla anguilla TaxID=7936 RepID=A0A0E9WVD6_ANGAN